MDISSAITFSINMMIAYGIVLWIQYSSWAKIKSEFTELEKKTTQLEKLIEDIRKENSELKKQQHRIPVTPENKPSIYPGKW